MLDKIWNYKTKRYAHKTSMLGVSLLEEYSTITETNILEFLSTPIGLVFLKSLLVKKMIVPKNSTKTVGVIVNKCLNKKIRPVKYVNWWITLHRMDKISGSPSSKIYLTKQFNCIIVNFFDNDAKCCIDTPIDLSDTEFQLFAQPLSKGDFFCTTCRDTPGLFSIESNTNWSEISPEFLVKISGECFELKWILKALEGQLNCVKNNCPYPQYPNLPTTRQFLSQDDLEYLKFLYETFQDKTIFPSVVVYFLLNKEIWFSKTYLDIINLFERDLRFQKLDENDGQYTFTGQWVPKTTAKSTFEVNFDNEMMNNVLQNFDNSSEESFLYPSHNFGDSVSGFWFDEDHNYNLDVME